MTDASFAGPAIPVPGPAPPGIRAAVRVMVVASVVVLLADAVHLARQPGTLPPEPLHWALALAGLLLGVRMVAYTVTNAVGWLFLTLGAVATATITSASWDGHRVLSWMQDWVWWPILPLLAVLALVFPTGRPATPRWWPVVGAVAGGGVVSTAAWAVVTAYSPLAVSDDAGAEAGAPPTVGVVVFGVGAAAVIAGAVLSVIGLVVQVRRSSGRQRRIVGCALAAASLVFVAVVVDAIWGAPWLSLAIGLPLPAAAAVAVTRYGLYDIDLLVHRTVLYGSLTLAVMIGYAAVVGFAAAAVPGAAANAAAPLLLVLLLPLRGVLQRRVDRLVYGARRAPHTVLARLGEQLEGRMAPAQILPVVVSAIATALKIPYAAIRWSAAGPPVAAYGSSRRRPQVELPLLFRGEAVGHLVVETRSPEEAFTAAERRALADLSRQAAAAAHAVRLIDQLQEARERLVTGREEERRRLRRDLHDGVGPALAGMTMQLGAARTLLATGRQEQATELVAAVEQQLADSAAEVRRAIRDLRPPALDEHGLVAALRQDIARFDHGGTGGMRVDVDASRDADTRLPAAVEVAALRIAIEAVTNAARHAAARRCVVTLRRHADAIELEVTDDGRGVAAGAGTGVGTHSMRERAAELGGVCSIRPGPQGGTRVHARLPVHQPGAVAP